MARKSPPTLRDIAEVCGLSRSGVSRALNKDPRVPQATRERVKKVAADLGYRPSAAMSAAMKAARSQGRIAYRETIAVLSNDIPLDQFPLEHAASGQMREFLAGLRERAEELGCGLDFLSVADLGAARTAEILQARGIRRAISVNPANAFPKLDRGMRIWDRFPTVFLAVRTSDWLRGTLVRPDYFAAGRKAFIEGWKAGYRKFAISHLLGVLNADRRFEAGLRFAGEYVLPGQSIDIVSVPLRSNKNLLEILDQVSSDTCMVGGVAEGVYPDLIEALQRPGSPAWIDWHANLYRSKFALAGIDQQDRQQAREAVTLCLSMDPVSADDTDTASATHLVSPKWVEGQTLTPLGNTSLNMEPEKPYTLKIHSRFAHVKLPSPARQDPSAREALSRFQNMPSIPSGPWKFHGVPFQIDPGPLAGIALDSGDKTQPARSLEIRRKARAIYFLHTCSSPHKSTEVAQYIIHFRGKDRRTLPLISLGDTYEVRAMPKDQALPAEVNIQGWWPGNRHFHHKGARSVCLLDMEKRPGFTGYLYTLEWINPRPGAVIESIELRPGQDPEAALLLCAITLAK